ncbi:SPFH domain-containing protein [Prauserella flavalba]|uniref:SPFH domain-containing protein n=1 Tax=Prauserella flavalba TaxID=1477506 RepID=UPI0036E3E58F
MTTPAEPRQNPATAQTSITEGTSGGWVLGAVLVTLGLCLSLLRVVGEGQRMVLLRFGKVVAVRGPGLVLVLPVLRRGVRVPLGATRVDLLWIDAVTADGVPVTVNGSLLATVTDPATYIAAPRSPGAIEAVAADQVRAFVRRRELAALAGPSRDALDAVTGRIGDRVRGWGVEVDGLELSRVEVRLGDELIGWAARRPGPERNGGKSTVDATSNRFHGIGTLHQIVTHGGQRLGLLVDEDGRSHVAVYAPEDPDVPAQTIVLEPGEADRLADLLHTRSVSDRLADLERRVLELTREAR